MAAPTLVGAGDWISGAQNPQPLYPAGLQQGDVVYLIVHSRPSTISANILAGWEFVGSATGGGGTEGPGDGPTRVSVLKRTVPSGGLSGALPSGLFTGTNAALAHLRAYRGASSSAVFTETFTSWSNPSASTNIGGTGGSGLSLATDDVVLIVLGGPDDADVTFTVNSITASGATFGALSFSPSLPFDTFETATGNDLAVACVTTTVTAGSSSSAPVVSATSDVSDTSMGFLLRIRGSLAASGGAAGTTTASASAAAVSSIPNATVTHATVASSIVAAGVAAGAAATITASSTVAAGLTASPTATTTSSAVATATKTDTAPVPTLTSFATSQVSAFRTGHAPVARVTTASVEASAFLLVGVEHAATVATATVAASEIRPDFGTIRIGRVTLTEHYEAVSESWSGDGRTLSLSGQESSPPLPERDIDALVDDLQNLQGTLVPVSFTWKQDRDGYYTVSSVSSELFNWGDTALTLDWKLTLTRAGADGEVDIESRLSGPQTRSNEHGATGERWHAPPIGAQAYWTGTTQPSTLTRPTSDGPIRVYRGIPASISPRYDVPAASYMLGRARILNQGRERTGVQWKTTPGGWELSNGLVRASLEEVAGGSTAAIVGPTLFPGPFTFPGSGVTGTVLRLGAWCLVPIFLPGAGYGTSPYGEADYGEAYGTEEWTSKDWTILLNGSAIGAPVACSVLRNDPECVSIRVLWTGAPAGRTTADLTLRRGARLVEMFLRTSYASTLKVARATPELATASTGYLQAATDDTDGNRFFIGSAGDYTADVIGGGISKSSTTSLDVALGVEMAGTEAAQGDQAASLYRQYLASCTEMVMAARR